MKQFTFLNRAVEKWRLMCKHVIKVSQLKGDIPEPALQELVGMLAAESTARTYVIPYSTPAGSGRITPAKLRVRI